MNDPRSKTEQLKERIAPSVAPEPSKSPVPTQPIVTSPQPKGQGSGGNPPHVANPKDPARLSTQAKP